MGREKLAFPSPFLIGFARPCLAFSTSERGHAVCFAYRWLRPELKKDFTLCTGITFSVNVDCHAVARNDDLAVSGFARRTHFRARPCCMLCIQMAPNTSVHRLCEPAGEAIHVVTNTWIAASLVVPPLSSQ